MEKENLLYLNLPLYFIYNSSRRIYAATSPDFLPLIKNLLLAG